MSKYPMVLTRFSDFHVRPREFDSHDDVDRISFVNSTVMIKRLIESGENLLRMRALAFSGGVIDNPESINDGLTSIVYSPDIAELQVLAENISSQISNKSNSADSASTVDLPKGANVVDSAPVGESEKTSSAES